MDKVVAVNAFRRPNDVKELQSFLGLLSYLGKFIPNLAAKTSGLRELSKEGSVNQWNAAHDKIIQEIKDILTKRENLGFFHEGDETILITDACDLGLGAILLQIDGTNERVIAYGSKSLSEIESRFCQTEKEALAVVWAMERFQLYLLGRKFELRTDCRALKFIYSERSQSSARLERWVLRLQCFDFSVTHIPGKQNIADTLSRMPVDEKEDISQEHLIRQIIEERKPKALSWEELKEHTSNDKEMLAVMEAVYEGNWDSVQQGYKNVKEELTIMDGLLLRRDRIVIPSTLREKILDLAHEGHAGIVGTKERLRSKVWYPRMDQDVERKVSTCKDCTYTSIPDPPQPITNTRMPEGPWEAVAMDFKEGFPNGESLLVVIDYFSRFAAVEILKPATAELTVLALRKMWASYGTPKFIKCDNGPQFKSTIFKRFYEEFGIKCQFTPPHWPQANGAVERFNRSLKKRIQIAVTNNLDWKPEIFDYLLMYNATKHSVTKNSPSDLMGRQIRDKIPSLNYGGQPNFELRDRDEEFKRKNKEYADNNRHAKYSDIQVGDSVLMRNYAKGALIPNFSPEELTVLSKEGGEVVVGNESGQRYRRNVRDTKKLKSTISQSADEQTEDVVTTTRTGKRTVKQPTYLGDYDLD